MPHALDGLMIFAGILLGLFIGAIILRAACLLYNMLAGLPDPSGPASGMNLPVAARHQPKTQITTEPPRGLTPDDDKDALLQEAEARKLDGPVNLGLPQAVGIILLATILNATVGFLVDKIFGGSRLLAGGVRRSMVPAAYFAMLPTSILVMAATLPTRFYRGLLIALLCVFLCLAFCVILFAAVFLLGWAAALHRFGW